MAHNAKDDFVGCITHTKPLFRVSDRVNTNKAVQPQKMAEDRNFKVRSRGIVLYKPCHEKSVFFAYAKAKTQITFAVTAKLISAFVFAP